MARRAEPAKGKASLEHYHAKRRFDDTPEPQGKVSRRTSQASPGIFVVQKHDATRLHYDFRLELDGVLLSWAVTKGPSLNPTDKRLAVRTEDHPLDYGGFEGIIPKGNYGAGTVMLWDRGHWEPIGDPHEELAKGKIAFNLFGEKMRGRWALVLMRRASEKRENWLLIKERDGEASEDRSLIEEAADSVASGRDLDAIAAAGGIWRSGKAGGQKPAKARAAKASKRPAFLAPQLATLVDAPPPDDGWIFEVKFDGYRTEIAANGADVRAYTRSGLDWTERFPRVIAAVKSLDLDGVLIDGEVVVMDEDGRSSFGALQNALQSGKGSLVYMAFDLLREGRTDWRGKPLTDRKHRLKEILAPAAKDGVLVYSDHVEGHGDDMLAMARDRKLEGVIAKRADRPYRSGRTESWLKIKVGHAQEFVVLGYRHSQKARQFSSLILGLRDGKTLRYVGRVGSGFSQETLVDLSARFAKIGLANPPAIAVPRDILKDTSWVKPELVVDIAFNGWTRDNLIRQGHYVGLREDKPAEQVMREEAKTSKAESKQTQFGVQLTHPEKVLFPDCGVTKADLADYLAQMADHMLPFAADRLVSLVRHPDGIEKEGFFQRHPSRGMDASWQHKAVKTSHGSEDYLYFSDPRALVAAAQIGGIEFHVWGSTLADIEKPDRIVFDLDPDEALPFAKTRDAAFFMRDVLGALGLDSLAMLSGGKGIHVIVPIKPEHDWPVIKTFARDLTSRVAADKPALYVATMTKAKRQGKIFIDHFRNERGSTAIAPFSPRARPGAPVAWPVAWDQLSKVTSANAVSLWDAMAKVHETKDWCASAHATQRITQAIIEAAGS
ncbi:DNA ligase D [Acidisoma cellulosilytica]|uniref:DNA ligase (ATP) n=1 Tax=Acidisoma cellulosilyticum TaxID=2802395 RepID=A0A963Z4X8_9PROT|nr:DNA ligase D [Acidisoma cellulosilyticum]MCB8882847.1 DNA ligase D [Acidisoma cellulosilyticum]